MISRQVAISANSLQGLASINEAVPVQAIALVRESAVQDFAVGVNTALLDALAAQGQNVSHLMVQRRLRAYDGNRITSSTKLRRYA